MNQWSRECRWRYSDWISTRDESRKEMRMRAQEHRPTSANWPAWNAAVAAAKCSSTVVAPAHAQRSRKMSMCSHNLPPGLPILTSRIDAATTASISLGQGLRPQSPWARAPEEFEKRTQGTPEVEKDLKCCRGCVDSRHSSQVQFQP
jgi:hypothetical protein